MLTVINLQGSLAYSTSINRKENRVGGWTIVSIMGPQPSQAAIMRDREGVQVTHHPSQAYAWEGCTAWCSNVVSLIFWPGTLHQASLRAGIISGLLKDWVLDIFKSSSSKLICDVFESVAIP